MIETREIQECRKCGSTNIVKNGHRGNGKQKYKCHGCGSYGTLKVEAKYSPERKAEILRAYQERSSMRGIGRTFGVARQTLATWLREAAVALPDYPPVAEAHEDDVLELDEVWSFVGSKKTPDGSG
jgi:transposase-like protein